MSAVLFALFIISAAGLVAIAGGVQALLMLRQPEQLPMPFVGAAERPAPPTRPRLSPSPPPAPSVTQAALDLPQLSSGLLAVTEPLTHDPVALLVRATELQRAGLPLQITHAALPPWETPTVTPFQVHTTVVSRGGRQPDAIEIGTVPKYSLLARAGFRQGDVVLSVDGYPAAGTEWTDHVFVGAERGGSAVVELVRERQRVVLALTWPPSPGG